jgi:hypothetical protein
MERPGLIVPSRYSRPACSISCAPRRNAWSAATIACAMRGAFLEILQQRHRRHFVKTTVQVHKYPDGTIALFHGAWRLVGYTEPLRPDPRQGSIPVGRNRRSATSFNQASVQSLVPVLPCRLSPDAGSRRNLNHSDDTRPAGATHAIEPVAGESVLLLTTSLKCFRQIC